MKRLRPAFVVTCAAMSACSSEPQQVIFSNPPHTLVPPTASATAEASASAAPTASVATTSSAEPSASASALPPSPTTRKRVGKADTVKDWVQAGPVKGPIKSLHPQDAQGRTILVGDDNVCFVQVPKAGPPPKDLPPGVPTPMDRIQLDCPEIFDDPAWDDRRSGWTLAIDEGTKTCLFQPMGGNPPPPNMKAKCPVKKKK
ncbi:MAG: hypothetical protein IPM79_10955 [Polyangiaceae bacterium]|jgi:hypothetical protein|nr:hypothetical protein [Polyangiaceae bacterium]MBK8938139.1 hypothetical protein [Polyangiaceae bacterium]